MRCRGKIAQRFSNSSFPGSMHMSMRAPKANKRTTSGRPGISNIPVGADSSRPDKTGDPSRIRTCNPRSRNPLLYPVELWDRWRLHSIANMKNPLCRQARSEPFCDPGRHTGVADLRGRPQRHAAPRRAAGLAEGSLRPMSHATFSRTHFAAISPSPFRAFLTFKRHLSAGPGAPS
jgi:hypothetical protein